MKLSDLVADQQPQAIRLSDVMTPQEPRSTGSEIGRQLGLTGRHIIEGVGNMAGLVADPINSLMGFQRIAPMASQAADSIGLPKPENGLEEAVGAGSRALVGTGLTAGAGLAGGVPALAAQPGLQAASAVTGGMSSDVARQEGAGPAGQAIAGLAGGLAPAGVAAAPQVLKTAVRGSDPAAMQATIDAFNGAGTAPTLGQAAPGGAAKFMESALEKIPGGSGVIAEKAQQQAEDVGGKLKSLATSLAPNADPAKAGRAIESAIRAPGGFVENFKQTAQDLYSKVDAAVPPNTAMQTPATQALLSKLTSPIPGAENVSKVLANPKMQALASALGEDLQASISKAGTAGTLPYQALSTLRSRVGQQIADAGLVSDTPVAQLKQLYGALSDDIRNGVASTGNADAVNAASRAETYYRAGMSRIEKIEPVIDKAGGPEAIFKAATSGTKDGATTINSVMQSLDPASQKVVTATILNKMGQATPGVATDGGQFSMQSFLTNWNNLSPAAKRSLFDRMGPTFRDDMDNIAATASNLRKGNAVYRNPSGTSKGAAQIGTVSTFVGSLLTGHPVVAAGVAAGVGAANLSAKLMANPTFVRWMANNSTKPVGQLPAQLSVLANIANRKNDPDLKQFVTLAQQGPQDQQAEGQQNGPENQER